MDFRIEGKRRYDFVKVAEYIQTQLDVEVKDEDIIAELKKGIAGAWASKLVDWARKFFASETYEDAVKNFDGSAKQTAEAVKKFFPQWEDQIPKKAPKKPSKKSPKQSKSFQKPTRETSVEA